MTEPFRTCVVCGAKLPKSVLHRYVWQGDRPVLDKEQKASGRGAYSCGQKTCDEKFVTLDRKWKRLFRL